MTSGAPRTSRSSSCLTRPSFLGGAIRNIRPGAVGAASAATPSRPRGLELHRSFGRELTPPSGGRSEAEEGASGVGVVLNLRARQTGTGKPTCANQRSRETVLHNYCHVQCEA